MANPSDRHVVILDGVRTPQGHLGGALKNTTSQELGELVVRHLLERKQIEPSAIEEVIFGCVGQSSDAPNLARVISLRAGLPIETPGFTVQRNCASGLQAITSACQNVLTGERQLQIAGGAEVMSAAPFLSRDHRFGHRLKNSVLIDSVWEGLTDPICGQLMGQTAENLVEEFGITREAQDAVAVDSHQRAFRATQEGKFQEEIVPVSVPKRVHGRAVDPDIVTVDEGINPALSAQMLGQYPTIFKEDGTVTPGNASPISDGAAAVLLSSEEHAASLGVTPLGYVRSWAYAALAPERMGLGPTKAVPKALDRAGITMDQVDLIEINEAFAAQVLACQQVLPMDWERTNVNGGAIALGHPVGCTGTRLVVTLLHEMTRQGVHWGVATMCVGGGQGGAIVLERP